MARYAEDLRTGNREGLIARQDGVLRIQPAHESGISP